VPAAASADWQQRADALPPILSGHGKPHLVRRIARLRCDARFRFSARTARNRACNPPDMERPVNSLWRQPRKRSRRRARRL